MYLRRVPVVDTVYSIMHCLFKLYVLVFYNDVTELLTKSYKDCIKFKGFYGLP